MFLAGIDERALDLCYAGMAWIQFADGENVLQYGG
jgi:hypothetical protein